MPLNVYVDGFNLYYGSLRGTPYRWLDLEALCSRLFPSDQIHRIRYFTAKVAVRAHDPQAPQRQDAYLRALQTLRTVSIHYGHFLTKHVWMPVANPQPGGQPTVRVIKTEEKGSDVNLATYLLLDAFQQDCDVAAVISNDSDLELPIQLTQQVLGVPVGVVNPHPAHKRSLVLQPSFFKQLRTSALAACQLPTTLQDAQGSIHKPAAW